MATKQIGGVNEVTQAHSGDYFTRAYRGFCELQAAAWTFPATGPDDELARLQEEADQVCFNMLTARATTLPQLAIKLRTLIMSEQDAMHSRGDDNSTVRNYTLLAADLDFIIAMQDAAGKAVRS